MKYEYRNLTLISALAVVGLTLNMTQGATAGTVSVRSAPEATTDEGQPRGDIVFGPYLYESHIVNGKEVQRFYDSETGVVCYLLDGKPWGCSPAPLRSVLDERYEGKDAK